MNVIKKSILLTPLSIFFLSNILAAPVLSGIKIQASAELYIYAAPTESESAFVPNYTAPIKKVFYGANYKSFAVTNNNYPDAGVEICGSRLAWQAKPNDAPNTDIFYYDGEDTHRVTNNDMYECTPSISSGGIAWEGYRPDGASDIFFYNFKDITRLTDDTLDDYRVNIYADSVVWCKHERIDGQIMLYKNGKIASLDGAHAIFPRASEGGIIYSSIRDGHLYLYDWNDIIDLGTTDVEYTQNAHNQQINRSRIVWRRSVGAFHEVFLYDISTGITTQITNGEINSAGASYQASVNGNYIAWRNRQGQTTYLRLYDNGEILTLASAPRMDEPYFGEGFLAWAMGDSDKDEDMEVFIYNLASKKIVQITDDEHPDLYPIASNEAIAWQKHDGRDYEIWMAYIFFS